MYHQATKSCLVPRAQTPKRPTRPFPREPSIRPPLPPSHHPTIYRTRTCNRSTTENSIALEKFVKKAARSAGFLFARRPSYSAATSFFSSDPRWVGVSTWRHLRGSSVPDSSPNSLGRSSSRLSVAVRHYSFGIHSFAVTCFGGEAGAPPRF